MALTTMEKSVFSPAAARVLYNAADAWHPPRPSKAGQEICGAGDFDLAVAISARADAQVVRDLEITLRCLDWVPRLMLSEGRFSWLPRHSRRAWLRRIESGGLPFLRKRVLRLRHWIDATYRELRDARGVAS